MSNPGTATVASPINLTTAAASVVLSSRLVQADAQPAFQVLGDGTLKWGPGGGGATDAALARTAPGVLTFTGTSPVKFLISDNAGLFVIGDAQAFRTGVGVGLGAVGGNSAVVGQPGPGFKHGIGFPAVGTDTVLYRDGGGVLRTAGSLVIDSNLIVGAGGFRADKLAGGSIIDAGWTANNQLSFFGKAPVAQPAHPVTLADVIAALTALGLTA